MISHNPQPSPFETSDAAKRRPVVSLSADEGESIWFLNQLVTVKLRGCEGPYGVVETKLPPGAGAPFHRHTLEDETFYVLEGELTLYFDEGRSQRARTGAFVHIPRGVAHAFRAETELRMLVLTDAGGFAEFTREYGVPAPLVELPPATAPDLARLDAVSRKHGIELLGPMPGGESGEPDAA
jgi:quercetin dioxygenase-like cupin family protein